MADLTPTKIKSSKILATLYIYAKQLQLLDEELTRAKNDQNIVTCRSEYIEDIWGKKLGQVFTSDFNITEYRQVLLNLVKIALHDSTKHNIKEVIRTYFPTVVINTILDNEVYTYNGDYIFYEQPIISITKVEVIELKSIAVGAPGGLNGLTLKTTVRTGTLVNTYSEETVTFVTPATVDDVVNQINNQSTRIKAAKVETNKVLIYSANGQLIIVGNGTANATFGFTNGQFSDYVERLTTDYQLVKDTGINKDSSIASDKLQFLYSIPVIGNKVRVSYIYNEITQIREYWKDNTLMLGYNWQNTSFKWVGAGAVSGTCGVGTDGTQIVDLSKSWTPNQWVNFGVTVPSKGSGIVTSNTATVLTVTISPAPVSTDAYTVGGIIPGNVWNGTKPWVANIAGLGYIEFGVQIHLRGLTSDDVHKVESYVIPALETFVRMAGIYYKVIVLDIDMVVSERIKDESTRTLTAVDSILGFGLAPFGDPSAGLPADDFGFGAPSLP